MSEVTNSPTAPSTTNRSSASRCVVVFGTKGGVGKTVVATNLAVSLAERLGKPVALVELDVAAPGDLMKMLGVSPKHTAVELAPQLKRPAPPDPLPLDGLVIPHLTGVHVVQCLDHPRRGHLLTPQLLQLLFQSLKARYEYVVVDAGKGFTDPLIAAFEEANLILLVTTPDIVSLYQTKWALGIIENLLFPPQMVKAVLNRAESRGGVSSEDVRLAMPCEFIGQIPSDGRAMGAAINQGMPVVKLFANAKITEAFLRLAERLIESPALFLSHQEIPRHRRATDGSADPTGFAPLSPRFYAPAMEGEPADGGDADEVIRLKRRIHEQLVDELDLKKVDLTLLTNPSHMQEMRQRCERVVAALLSREVGGIIASHEVRARFVKEILDEALGLGPIEELLDDPTISDVLVNNKDQIYIERKGKLELTTKKFISNDQVRAVIERIVAPLGRRIDESVPMVDARLPDGSRVNAIIPPLSLKGPVLSIRKFVGIRYSQEQLIAFGSLTHAMGQFLNACVASRKNVIISGGTGSGKTTLLNIVSSWIPQDERIISIEDAAELKLLQPHWVSLESRSANVEGKGHISIRDLFRNALRMRPDRIIIGECRGGETLDMLQAMNTGHDGSLTTVHANSPRDVISRLDSMVLMSNVELPIRAIREMVASAVDLIVHTARLSDGSRKITSVTEVTGLAEDGIEIHFQDLFVFQQTGVAPDGTVLGQFAATGQLPTFFHELKVKGIAVHEAMFQANAGSAIPSPPVQP